MWIVVVIVCIFLIIAACSSRSKVIDDKPANIVELSSEKSIDDLYKILIGYTQDSRYKIESFDDEKHVIVFGDEASLTSWGFLYPVYLSENNGERKIEIGIKSKAVQVGPIVTSSHDKFVTAIKVLLKNNE